MKDISRKTKIEGGQKRWTKIKEKMDDIIKNRT